MPVVVAAALLAGSGGARAQGAPAHRAAVRTAAATIKSVAFTGSKKHPTVTILGSGFGHKPQPNLGIAPYQAGSRYGSACAHQRVAGDHNDGHDYSPHLLGLGWGKTPPSGYGAGVYSPHHYLDCIGLKIVKYTGTKIVLHLGCQYALYPKIVTGDKALVVVNHQKIRLTVRYQR